MKQILSSLLVLTTLGIGQLAYASGSIAPRGEYFLKTALSQAYDGYVTSDSSTAGSSQMFHIYSSGTMVASERILPGQRIESNVQTVGPNYQSAGYTHTMVEVTWLSDTAVQLRFNGPETNRMFTPTSLPEVRVQGALAGGHTRNDLPVDALVEIVVSDADRAAADAAFSDYLSEKNARQIRDQLKAQPDAAIDSVEVEFKTTRFALSARGFEHAFNAISHASLKVAK